VAFRFEPLAIPDVIRVVPERHGDARGRFMETYRRSAFREGGIDAAFVQDNAARSRRGVLRGLHFQVPPSAQGKLIRVVRGRVYDVAVDLRRGSPYRARWVGMELDPEEGALLWVPPGFAHGYCVLSEVAEVTYKVTAEYAPGLERGIRWDDPELGIDWPVDEPLLSPKDRGLPRLSSLELPFRYEVKGDVVEGVEGAGGEDEES